MRQPIDAYREGYERGKTDRIGGVLAEMTMGMLRDDPGGHFAAGYHAGRSGKDFAPPLDEAPQNNRHGDEELNPFDDKVAIRMVCPNCGDLDWFEWKFLGRLTDPICGHTWYAGSGTYALMQIRAAFSAGKRYAKHTTSGVSGEGAWIVKTLGWLVDASLGLCIRLECGLLMVPIQAIVGLCQSRKTITDVAGRLIAIVISVSLLGLVGYEIRQNAVTPSLTKSPQNAQPPTSARPSQSSPASRVQKAPATSRRPTRLRVNLQAHCLAHGFQSIRNRDGTGYGWVCTPGDTPLNLEQACHEQYGASYKVRLASRPPGGMNDWYCSL